MLLHVATPRLCLTQVCRALVNLGHSVTVITGAPAGFFLRELSSPRLAVRKASLDFGAKQKDAFSVDMSGTSTLCLSSLVAALHILLGTALPLPKWC